MWKTESVKKETISHLSVFAHRHLTEVEKSRKFVTDAVDFIFERAVIGHLAFDHVNGREDRRVISAEDFCRILQRQIGDVSNDVDGNVSCESDLRRAFFALDILDGNVISLGNVFDDLFSDERRRHGK